MPIQNVYAYNDIDLEAQEEEQMTTKRGKLQPTSLFPSVGWKIEVEITVEKNTTAAIIVMDSSIC